MNAGSLQGRRIAVMGLGDLGAAVAQRLQQQGARVLGLRRGTGVPEGVELLRADLADRQSLEALPADIEAVVVSITPDRYDPEGYRRTYLMAAENLAAVLAGRPLTRLLWVSSSSVYGAAEGADASADASADAEFDDDSVAEPPSERARILLAAEQALAAGGWPVTALRLTGIYGPGRRALIDRVLAGRGAPAEPVHWTNRIHRDDAVEAIVFLLQLAFRGVDLPAVVIGSDGAPAPRNEVLAWLAQRLGVELTTVDEDPGRAPSRRLRPRVLQSLGFQWRYPDYRAGYAAMLPAAAPEQGGESGSGGQA